jgi:hypothetical protein
VNNGRERVKESIEDIVDDDEYVEFHTMKDESELITCIKEHVNPEHVVNGVKTYIGKNLFQTIFEALPNTVDHSDTSINKLGSQFADGLLTAKPVILIKNVINSDTDATLSSLSQTEVQMVLEEKFLKKGVVYSPQMEKSQYVYCQNHLDNMMEKFGQDYVLQNFQYDEMEICDMVFIIASNKNETEDNKIMTEIVGKPVKGNAFCSLYYKADHKRDSTYISMDIDMFDHITYLLMRSDFDNTDDGSFVNLTKENAEELMNDHDPQIVIPPRTIIERLYHRYKNKD